MLVVTRIKVSKRSHPSFTFEQLTTTTRCPCRKTYEEELILDRQGEANTWHNPLYSFDNFFDTPFDTPRVVDIILLIIHPEERNHILEKIFAQN